MTLMSDVLGWLPTAVAFVLFLGAAVVYLRGSKDKGTIDTLERNNRALNERVGILETEAREDHAKREIDRERIKSLEQKNEVLEGVANSSDAIAAQSELVKSLAELMREMSGSLKTHHGAAMAGIIQVHEDLDSLPERLAAVIREAIA